MIYDVKKTNMQLARFLWGESKNELYYFSADNYSLPIFNEEDNYWYSTAIFHEDNMQFHKSWVWIVEVLKQLKHLHNDYNDDVKQLFFEIKESFVECNINKAYYSIVKLVKLIENYEKDNQ